ncbi:phosphopantothenate-cysteine ligase /phosphopantothenoylcysteine decarboxylase [Scopulibacillus darangshiensis]|uniref:Coenzyme A biosynthesis bifunctional protein CoaBC n=1 Tax=Scopulibacillus darangshiensis TaxID=442528 RepID=A0A4R2P3F7_9BACL|nr:bifunctional phosphopantothenoylcysteine decarboxylase/phosphopantothenate--cysteine ligase CoaBC [Scopulibacillus darangshiensis]TCP29127.1 phosphopantothenate-cysteine ligase /phosphopantothenoylcysteine decarboxylase [Scopulibacillus darangshiensis]
MLKGKKIVLCVTGGIAAYKAATLTSLLKKAGCMIDVVMTSSAKQFVGPSTFQALSRRPVHDDLFTEKDPEQIAHIDLADKADLILVAPATANTIGKMANGLANDIVTTTVLASKAPVWVAPAMNVNMYHHPSVQKNLLTLRDMGYRIIEPGSGPLACGWVGKGRLSEPEDIFAALKLFFTDDDMQPLKGKCVLVTAGPTREGVDPVRYFTNYSSGKMGYAVARAAHAAGAEVILVSGPTSLKPPEGVELVNVISANEMYEQVMNRFDNVDAVIKSAAVADYRPKVINDHKIKKADSEMIVKMVRNPDILAELGSKKQDQILIGFAAESENIDEYAKKKLEKKRLDLIVANNILEDHSGFDSDTNHVTFFFPNGTEKDFELMSKEDVARQLCSSLASMFEKRAKQ